MNLGQQTKFDLVKRFLFKQSTSSGFKKRAPLGKQLDRTIEGLLDDPAHFRVDPVGDRLAVVALLSVPNSSFHQSASIAPPTTPECATGQGACRHGAAGYCRACLRGKRSGKQASDQRSPEETPARSFAGGHPGAL